MTAFPERAARLSKIVQGLDLVHDFPLLKVALLPSRLIVRLRHAVNLYLYATLASYYRGQDFDLNGELLTSAAEAIRNLPNITPNGLVLPKKQNYLAYNMVHATLAEIFAELALPIHVVSVHAPINLRLVDGRADPTVDVRPRASAKWHSDMWAGEPAAAVICFLPVFGPVGSLGVRWIEPNAFPAEFAKPLDDFERGAHLIAGGTEYPATFDPGTILLSDPYLVHATQRDVDGLRLSVDFRFISRYPIASDAAAPGTRGANYLDYDDWRDIGHGRLLTSDAPLEPYTGPDIATANEYAAPYEIRKLGD